MKEIRATFREMSSSPGRRKLGSRFHRIAIATLLVIFGGLIAGDFGQPLPAAEPASVAKTAAAKNPAASMPAATMPAAAKGPVDFVHDIRPILQRSCYRCHGPRTQKSGYRLDVRSVAMKGGDAYAPNIIAKNGAGSPLVRFVAGVDDDVTMPPEGKRLSAEEVGLLRAWIDQGAVWPDEAAGKVADKTDWWSLKPLVQGAVPTVAQAPATAAGSAPLNPIDAFIRQTLVEKQFPHAPEADRAHAHPPIVLRSDRPGADAAASRSIRRGQEPGGL